MNPSPRRKALTRTLALVILAVLATVAYLVLKSVTATQRSEEPPPTPAQQEPALTAPTPKSEH